MTVKKMRSEKRKATKIINLRLTKSEMTLVESAAEAHEVSVSAFIKNRVFDEKKLSFKTRSEKKESGARDQTKMLRVTPAQHSELMLMSEDAELSASNYMRHKLFGYRTRADSSSLLLNEINRQKGLAKLIYIQSSGEYAALTAEIVKICVSLTFLLADDRHKKTAEISLQHAKEFCVELRENGAKVKSAFDIHFTDSPEVEIGFHSILNYLKRLKEVVSHDS